LHTGKLGGKANVRLRLARLRKGIKNSVFRSILQPLNNYLTKNDDVISVYGKLSPKKEKNVMFLEKKLEKGKKMVNFWKVLLTKWKFFNLHGTF
jgi:hypothetical protein